MITLQNAILDNPDRSIKAGLYHLFSQVFKDKAHHPWPLIYLRRVNLSQYPEFSFQEITFYGHELIDDYCYLMRSLAYWILCLCRPTTFLPCPARLQYGERSAQGKLPTALLSVPTPSIDGGTSIEWMTKKTAFPCPGGRNDVLQAYKAIHSCRHTSTLHPRRRNLQIKILAFIATYGYSIQISHLWWAPGELAS